MSGYLIPKDKVVVNDESSMWHGVNFGPGSSYAWATEDFLQGYLATDWTITNASGGTLALSDAENGVLLVTNAGADNNFIIAQLSSEAFKPEAGRNIYFEALVEFSDDTQIDWFVGLSDTDTGLPTTPSDGVYFRKDDGDTKVDCGCASGSTESVELDSATAESASYMKLGFKIIGLEKVEYYFNGSKVSEVETNIPTTEMRLSFAVRNGEAVAKTMKIDKYVIAQSR